MSDIKKVFFALCLIAAFAATVGVKMLTLASGPSQNTLEECRYYQSEGLLKVKP